MQTDVRERADEATLAFAMSADPAHVERVLGDVWKGELGEYGRMLLRTLVAVHRKGMLGRDVFVYIAEIEFKVVEIAQWDLGYQDGTPVINVTYRFAAHPLAPRTRVEFAIGYGHAVDGTENLVYSVSKIEEEEGQDPQGT